VKIQMKSLALGFILAILSFLGILAAFLFLSESGNYRGVFRDQVLPSGKIIKVTSFYLVWGQEHDDRTPSNDCFDLEYVSSIPKTEPQERDQEALEVFELIRPISELWGFNRASISVFQSVFQSTQRKDAYDRIFFARSSDGKWSFKRYPGIVRK
jgi:hypothetical protein